MSYTTGLFDPPWAWKSWSDKGKGRAAEKHYPVMTLERLKALPVPDVMARDSVLLMWATWPMLIPALELGAHWGYTYKTMGFLWAKTNRRNWASFFTGLGYWTRANTEPCLLFTRGKPRRKSKAVRQLIVAPVMRHSQKPDDIHARIEQLCEGRYLEVFARRPVPGWTCLGNEIDGKDIAISMGELCQI